MPTPWNAGDKAQDAVALERFLAKIEHVLAIARTLRERDIKTSAEGIDILCFALASLLQSQTDREYLPEVYEVVIKRLYHYTLGSESDMVRGSTEGA